MLFQYLDEQAHIGRLHIGFDKAAVHILANCNIQLHSCAILRLLQCEIPPALVFLPDFFIILQTTGALGLPTYA